MHLLKLFRRTLHCCSPVKSQKCFFVDCETSPDVMCKRVDDWTFIFSGDPLIVPAALCPSWRFRFRKRRSRRRLGSVNHPVCLCWCLPASFRHIKLSAKMSVTVCCVDAVLSHTAGRRRTDYSAQFTWRRQRAIPILKQGKETALIICSKDKNNTNNGDCQSVTFPPPCIPTGAHCRFSSPFTSICAIKTAGSRRCCLYRLRGRQARARPHTVLCGSTDWVLIAEERWGQINPIRRGRPFGLDHWQ